MTREIKFRAWDNKKKEWLMGYEMPNLGGFSLYGECVLLGDWSAVVDQFLFSRNGYTPDDLIVMQFTGLKDNKGKEIYEGDIVIIATKYPKKKEPQIVGWDATQSRFCFIYNTGEPMREFHVRTEVPHFEVIGNVYENKDLLSQ